MKRGAVLGTVLMVVAVVLVVAFSLAGTAAGTLSFCAQFDNLATARNAADSAAAAAAGLLLNDVTFGSHASDAVQTPSGHLTFDASQTATAWSTYNYDLSGLQPQSDKTGYEGINVPKQTVLLIGTGQYHGTVARLATLLAMPPFPYAVASAGKLAAPTGMLVASLPAGTPASANLDPTRLLAANVASNQFSGTALALGQGSRITGDAHAVGGVVLSGNAVINGCIISPAEPAPLPRIQPDQVRPLGGPMPTGAAGNNTGMHVSGYSEGGPLNVGGDLWLDNAVLFVDGDLQVSGGLRGVGAVVVSGNTTLGGASSLQAAEQAALIAMGGATLQSNNGAPSYFNGVVYTEGPFLAQNVVMSGAFVANSPPGAASAPPVTIQNATVVQNSAYQSFTINLPTSTVSPGGGVSGPPPLTPQTYGFDEGLGNGGGGVSMVFNGGPGWATYQAGHGWTFDPNKIQATINICVPMTTDPTQHVVFSLPMSDVQSAIQNPAAAAALMQQMQSAVTSHESGPVSAEVLAEIQANLDPNILQSRYQGFLAGLHSMQTSWPAPGSSQGQTPPPPTQYRFDLNKFLGLADRWRVMMWRML